MRYLNHLTINTGNIRRSWRGEVADDVVDHMRELLADAIQSGGDTSMPICWYMLHVEPFGDRRALLCTISGVGGALAAIGVAARPARALWGQLIALRHRLDPDVRPVDEPQAPWCSVLLLPALREATDALDWLGDFERCVGWAWLEGPK
ncbi:MAG: hypothetical protein ACOY45_02760 [Pseudomonadota bacterium]